MTDKPLTYRKAKRLLGQCDDWVLFTSKNNGDDTANLECATMAPTSWASSIDFASADENFYNALETISTRPVTYAKTAELKTNS